MFSVQHHDWYVTWICEFLWKRANFVQAFRRDCREVPEGKPSLVFKGFIFLLMLLYYNTLRATMWIFFVQLNGIFEILVAFAPHSLSRLPRIFFLGACNNYEGHIFLRIDWNPKNHFSCKNSLITKRYQMKGTRPYYTPINTHTIVINSRAIPKSFRGYGNLSRISWFQRPIQNPQVFEFDLKKNGSRVGK